MANKKKVYFDAGHGGYDPGAVKYVKESEVNIKVVKYAVAYLKKHFDVEVYEDLTANDSLATICNRANKWKADLFVSIHFNAGGGDGFEAWVYSSANKALGVCFEKYVKQAGQNSRGVKYDPELIVLNSTDMKAILCEIAFVDNKKDIKDWDENAELEKMGKAIALATADWLDLPTKVVKYKTLYGMNFRKKAGLNSDVISFIPKGTVLNVESVDKNGWGKLTYKNETGYVRIKGQTKTYCEKV